MASYPAGTIFSSAQTFPPNSTFGDACLFPDGCFFMNPCTFGAGCIFGKGCTLARTDPRQPPHRTGTACVFDERCVIDWVIIGEANIIQNPAQYSPVSQGTDVLVGNSNASTWPSRDVQAESDVCDGMVVSGEKVSENWCEASRVHGFDAANATVERECTCPGA